MAVLIIDDEQTIRDLASRILERAGFDIVAKSTGREGLDYFAEKGAAVEAVLLDLMMPEMSGVETLEGLRTHSESVPVVISSGTGEPPESIPSQLLKNVTFLRKPYRSRQLLDTIRAAIAAVPTL